MTDSVPNPLGRVPVARTVASGFLMGAADVVPGVSGGTVALILGVYERLVKAISQCNSTFVRLILKREWKQAADHIDLKFVASLGCGIAIGVGGLASLMNYLLNHHMTMTFAAFTGMILASSLLVWKRIASPGIQHSGLLMMGILIALRLVTLPMFQNPPDAKWYLFACGMVGITAMILPGISGAFILLLLGRYEMITHGLKTTLKGNLEADTLLGLAVFSMGCLVGLLSFSRVLRWLLSRQHDTTMAVLCGFMLGSLYKLWPFQKDITPATVEVTKFRQKEFQHFVPNEINQQLITVVALAGIGLALVLILDAVSGSDQKSPNNAVTD